MVPGKNPHVVEWIDDPSTTAGGGWVRDNNGNTWRVVDAFGPQGTGDQHAYLKRDGRIVGRVERL